MLEGHTFDEALERWPEMIAKWLDDYNQPPPGGERIDEFVQRVSHFYDGIRQDYAEKTVLIVAHGGPLREIIQSLLVHSTGPTWWFSLDHVSLTDFQIDDENVIINPPERRGPFKRLIKHVQSKLLSLYF